MNDHKVWPLNWVASADERRDSEKGPNLTLQGFGSQNTHGLYLPSIHFNVTCVLSKQGGAGRGKGQNPRGGAGQNVSISADLDHLLKEGKP